MKKIEGLRWGIITLIAIATVINYIDRSSLAVMWPDISRDLGLSKEQYAGIVSAFMVAYAVGQGLSGRLIDWVGTRVGFVICIAAWSVSCALHGVARSVVGFSAFRALLGLSEAGNWPGATKANAEWFPVNERAFAQGIFNAGASIGSVISAPLIAILYVALGWKMTFVVIGALGLLWIIPWWIVNRANPADHPWITDRERDHILSGQSGGLGGGDDRALGWGELLRHRQSWSVIVGRFFLDPVWWMFVTWLPIYLAEQFGFNIQQIGLFGWVPYVGAAIGSLAGGWWSGSRIRGGWSVDRARKQAMVIGGVFMFPALLASAFASTPLIAVLLMAVALFGFQFTMNNLQTLPSDFFSGKSVGSLAGLGGTSAVAGVLIMIWIVPVITRTSYVPFFLLGALMVPLCLGSVLLFAGEIRRVPVGPERDVHGRSVGGR